MPAHIVSGPRRASRSGLVEDARRAASGFRDLGASGGRVALLLRNDAPFVTVAEAARFVGATAVPINWHFSAPEIAYVLEDCGASILVTHSDIWNALAGGLPDRILERMTVICVATPEDMLAAYGRTTDGATIPSDVLEWTAFCAAHDPIEEPPENIAFPVIYTSGTTGNPKGVMRKGRAVPSRYGYDAFFEAGITTLLAAPIYHSAPFRFCMGTFAAEGNLILPPRFDAEETLALIEKHSVTTSFMVPTMVNRLLRLPEDVRSRYDLSSLQHVVSAGAPFPPELKAALIAWWGPVIYEYYGSTETGAMTFCTSDEALERPGTVGKTLPIARIEILDEARNPVPVGEIGEVFGCRSDYPEFEYLNRPEALGEVAHDGLITSGDIGYFDEDGYLFLSDRKRDMIIAGGVNIYPAHIEAALLQHPAVLDVAVFGIPDPDLGEAVAAAIETPDGTAPDFGEIRAFLAEKIAKYMIPRQFTHEAKLPRDPAGKLKKRVLRDPYWTAERRAI